MGSEEIVAEFTHQAESFNSSAVATSAAPLETLMRLARPGPDQVWLESACGPGIVSRRLAPQVKRIHGVDMTPAMIDLARREAAAAGAVNASFELGDATALPLPDAGFDGAITRFSLHHIPAPGRVFEELARVVVPGGTVVVADHLADDDAEAAAWSLEIERLRDPSHWACLPAARLRRMGAEAGLTLEDEALIALVLDFGDWLRRGSGGAGAQPVIERLLDERPARAECFDVEELDGRRVLRLRMWAGRWRRPA